MRHFWLIYNIISIWEMGGGLKRRKFLYGDGNCDFFLYTSGGGFPRVKKMSKSTKTFFYIFSFKSQSLLNLHEFSNPSKILFWRDYNLVSHENLEKKTLVGFENYLGCWLCFTSIPCAIYSISSCKNASWNQFFFCYFLKSLHSMPKKADIPGSIQLDSDLGELTFLS